MEIKDLNWKKLWAGSYTFTSCAYWGPQYFHTLNRMLGECINHPLFVHKKGTVSCFIRREELDKIGKYLAKKAVDDERYATNMLNNVKENTDKIMQIMIALEGRIPTDEEYKTFLNYFEKHLAYHVFMKEGVDYLPPELLTRLFPAFKDARIYSEHVYSKTEAFFRDLAKTISKNVGYKEEHLTCLLQEELEAHLTKKTLPSEEELRERYEASALLCINGKNTMILGEKAIQLENSIQKGDKDWIKGTVAYNGKISGRCRIIHDPFAKNNFKEGDILITGMTRPEFIPLMEKASAIVTDAGGILCHAAITAREMKKPCIVGTERVTKTFKDGDYIEVDAHKGIVKKLTSTINT
jgi:phosphohistidine swiveling domain-containing protein